MIDIYPFVGKHRDSVKIKELSSNHRELSSNHRVFLDWCVVVLGLPGPAAAATATVALRTHFDVIQSAHLDYEWETRRIWRVCVCDVYV
jgi:hypothetical protein